MFVVKSWLVNYELYAHRRIGSSTLLSAVDYFPDIYHVVLVGLAIRKRLVVGVQFILPTGFSSTFTVGSSCLMGCGISLFGGLHIWFKNFLLRRCSFHRTKKKRQPRVWAEQVIRVSVGQPNQEPESSFD